MKRDFVCAVRATALMAVGALTALNLTCVQGPTDQTPSPLALPLTISVARPTDNVVVSDETAPEIRWADIGPNDLDGDGLLNDPPLGSTVTIKLDPDVPAPDQQYEQDGNEIDLLGPVDAVDDVGDSFDFDGFDAAGDVVPVGTYYVIAVLDDGAGTELTDLSLGTIRVPLTFTKPREDAELAEADDSITIQWEMDDGGLGGSLSLGLDADLDHTSGNEEILAGGGPFDGSLTSLELTASMITAGELEPGTYYLYAWIEQSGLDDMFVTAPVQITLGNFSPPTMEFVDLDDDLEVLVGDTVTIEWDDEDVDDNATIDLFVDPDQNHNNGNEIQLLWNRLEDPDGEDDRFAWNTTGQRPDEYYVFATISDGRDSVDAEAAGRIILRNCQDCPLITLIQPASVVSSDVTRTVAISWDDGVPSAQAVIALYYVDFDETETLIADGIEANPDQAGDDLYEWDLLPDDLTESAVPEGAYDVKAYIKDGSASPTPPGDFDGWDVASGKVVVVNMPPRFEFVSPEQDAVLVIGGANDLIIEWQGRDPEDEITFDLFIDPDADHTNGNERQINLDSITAGAGPQSGSFEWTNNGTDVLDAAGQAVPPGEYTLLAVVTITVGVHEPITVEADGKVRVQSAAGSEPWIRLDAPVAIVTVRVGDRVRIEWQDFDTNADTKIRLRYDDDPTPDQDPGSETGEDEENITGLIDAQPDGDDDEFRWLMHPDPQVDAANILEPAIPEGTYYVFAYIGGADPLADPSWVAVAPGKVGILNSSPELIFTVPDQDDIELPLGAGGMLEFNYRDPEDEMQVKLYLDPDQFHDNGNEVRIDTGISLPVADDDSGSGDIHTEPWDGTNIAAQDVPTGTYFLFAEVDDGVSSAVTVEADAKINVIPASPKASRIGADVDNGGGAGPYELTDSDVSVDFVAAGVAAGDRVKITGGTGVNVGVYNVTEGGVAQKVLALDADAGDSGGNGDVEYSVYVKNPDVAGVIVLATPASNITKDVGETVDISWADFTPVGSETVTLVYSTNPAASMDHGVDPDDPYQEKEIVSGVAALPDGLSDSDTWDTAGVDPDTYFIHAKILDDGGTVLDVSTACGTVEVEGVQVTPTFEFLQPANVKDLTFSPLSTMDIVWQYESSTDGTVSIFLDRDTTNSNGNETYLASNLFQAEAPGGGIGSLDGWDLKEEDGPNVPTGIYYVRGVLNVLGHGLKYETAAGQLKIRNEPGSPLVQLSAPGTTISFNTQDWRDIQITWEPDPSNSDGEVYVWYSINPDGDDDNYINPSSGGAITRVSGDYADVENSDGTYTLTDTSKDFSDAGVEVGDTCEVFGGTGVSIGKYGITAVAPTVLTLDDDAGDSGSEADVSYAIPVGVAASQNGYLWRISPGDLGADTYYIHAVIGRTGDYTNDDDRDTAKGKVIVSDP